MLQLVAIILAAPIFGTKGYRVESVKVVGISKSWILTTWKPGIERAEPHHSRLPSVNYCR